MALLVTNLNGSTATRRGRTAAIILLFTAVGAALPAPLQAEDTVVASKLEVVHTFGDDFRLVGIGASRDGRVFATAPSSDVRSAYSMVEVDTTTGKLTPYPNAAWNSFHEDRPGDRQWINVQALWVDSKNDLWALDCSLPKADQAKLPPKLVQFDLKTNTIKRVYEFKGVVDAKDSLNDVRVDRTNDFAYLTNVGKQGSLVVLDLKTGVSRQVLVGDRSTKAAEGEHLMINGEPARKKDGSVLVLNADGIALSPDDRWLYYRPLTDHNYWRIPTAALRDEKLDDVARANKVQFLGKSVLSGGLIMDRTPVLYGGNLEDHSVVGLVPSRDSKSMKESVLVRDPAKLSWADGFAESQGYLYIADSHLWEIAFQNSLPRSGPFTIFKMKLPATK